MTQSCPLTRRKFLAGTIASLTLPSCGGARLDARDAQSLSAAAPRHLADTTKTPSARPPQQPAAPALRCAATEDNIEGPSCKTAAPSRAVLAGPRRTGQRIIIAGRVLDAQGKPMAGVRIEFWQADGAGTYDIDGYSFRGQLRTHDGGHYQLETIVPGRYQLNPSQFRPAHIYFKLRAHSHMGLTTQPYFPDDPYNRVDPFIRRSLIMEVRKRGRIVHATYDFVLP